jgi:hypothetical protein
LNEYTGTADTPFSNKEEMISSKHYGFCVRLYFLTKNLHLGQLKAISNQSLLQIFVHDCDGLRYRWRIPLAR